MEKVDIFALIDELQEEIELSPTRGLSKNKSVDAKIVMEIIEDIKQALHEELDFSRRVVGEKDQILNAAQTQADEIIKRAKLAAEELVKEDAVSRSAYDKASKLLENSKQKAAEIRQSANTYAEEVFDELEDYYKECIGLIKENKARLYGKAGARTEEE